MTRRSPLWITALAVALGAAAWAPTGAGAQEGEEREQQDLVWDVTIDTEDVVASRDVVVAGRAVGRVAGIGRPDSVVVTVEPLGLPPQCGDDDTVIEDVGEDGSYRTVFRTKCNGPYRLEVAAQVNGVPSTRPTVKQIGVGEAPPAPSAPSPDGAFMRWAPPTDPDAHGWLLMVDEGEPQELGLDVTSASVPADRFTHTFELVLVRWGAGGPGTDLLASPKSPAGASSAPIPQKPGPEGPGPEVPGPVDPPTGEPPPSGSGPPGSSSTAPPTSGSTTPSRGTGAPSTTLPAGYTEELPYGVPDDAFEPGSDPASDGASGDEETAAGTSPARGLVSTSEERAPGLVAPFALGLLLITVAVHIAWFLRRSRPPGGGQVMPH